MVFICLLYCFFCYLICIFFFFFKQKTAYEMRISDWSSDVCSSDLPLDMKTAGWRSAWIYGCVIALCQPLAACGDAAAPTATTAKQEIGRASCRERVCQYV